jgi:hypothetical protein
VILESEAVTLPSLKHVAACYTIILIASSGRRLGIVLRPRHLFERNTC